MTNTTHVVEYNIQHTLLYSDLHDYIEQNLPFPIRLTDTDTLTWNKILTCR
jgi:hypothetical protein